MVEFRNLLVREEDRLGAGRFVAQTESTDYLREITWIGDNAICQDAKTRHLSSHFDVGNFSRILLASQPWTFEPLLCWIHLTVICSLSLLRLLYTK